MSGRNKEKLAACLDAKDDQRQAESQEDQAVFARRIVVAKRRAQAATQSVEQSAPSVEQAGLGNPAVLDHFAARLHELEPVWNTLSEDEREVVIGAALNDTLERVGVLGVTVVFANLLVSGRYGAFIPSLWMLSVDRNLVASVSSPILLSALGHEARHAEQWFRMARVLAGQGATAEQIVEKLEMEPIAAAAAWSAPLHNSPVSADWLQQTLDPARKEAYHAAQQERTRTADTYDCVRETFGDEGQEHPVAKNAIAEANAREKKAQDNGYENVVTENEANVIGEGLIDAFERRQK